MATDLVLIQNHSLTPSINNELSGSFLGVKGALYPAQISVWPLPCDFGLPIVPGLVLTSPSVSKVNSIPVPDSADNDPSESFSSLDYFQTLVKMNL